MTFLCGSPQDQDRQIAALECHPVNGEGKDNATSYIIQFMYLYIVYRPSMQTTYIVYRPSMQTTYIVYRQRTSYASPGLQLPVTGLGDGVRTLILLYVRL